MTAAKPTAGPWRTDVAYMQKQIGRSVLPVYGEDRILVADCPIYVEDERATVAANAHLIARAPALVEALRRITGTPCTPECADARKRVADDRLSPKDWEPRKCPACIARLALGGVDHE